MTGILNILAGSISSAIKDGYFNLVSLLLPGNGTNGAQNNTFLDSSSNNFTITRNGNTTQGTFSPFSQTGWGNYFNGSSDYLTVADNAALDLGTGNFTIEAWIFATSVSPATNFTIVAKGGSSATGTWQLDITSGSKLRLQYDTAGAITSTASLVANTWNHVVAVREGTGSNQTKIYINGTNDGTGTVSSDLGDASTVKIGLNRDGTTYFPGYISNLRIVKGTAVYTSAFTPPTSALTAITNTSLLTCQSNRFIDNSSNAFAITVNGTPSVQAFSPFAPTAAYSAATNGGSGYFDGTGDYLTLAAGSAFAPGTGAFTVEGWYYSTTTGNQQVWAQTVAGLDYFVILYDQANSRFRFIGNGVDAYSPTTVYRNCWNHFAVVRNGTSVTVYANGAAGTSVTFSDNFSNTTYVPTISGYTHTQANMLTGYVSGLRYVKGTAVYTTAFTPPTSPLTAISGTSLLLNFTNAGITDATSKNVLETVGNAQISTTQSKFGGSSMYFDGTGDYLQIQSSGLFGYGTGDFTIEFWGYFTSISASTPNLIDQRNGSATAVAPTLYLNNGTLTYYVNGNNRIVGNALSANTWYHIVICRSGTNTKLFVDGTQVGSTYVDSNNYITSPVRIFANNDGGSLTAQAGYVDDLRITRGYARYTANFTPPAAAFALQ